VWIADQSKRDSSLRRPTTSQERSGKKKPSARYVRNDDLAAVEHNIAAAIDIAQNGDARIEVWLSVNLESGVEPPHSKETELGGARLRAW
jgi:hypothetical protein